MSSITSPMVVCSITALPAALGAGLRDHVVLVALVAGVDVDRDEREVDRRAGAELVEDLQQRPAVLAARQADHDAVAVLDQQVIGDGLGRLLGDARFSSSTGSAIARSTALKGPAGRGVADTIVHGNEANKDAEVALVAAAARVEHRREAGRRRDRQRIDVAGRLVEMRPVRQARLGRATVVTVSAVRVQPQRLAVGAGARRSPRWRCRRCGPRPGAAAGGAARSASMTVPSAPVSTVPPAPSAPPDRAAAGRRGTRP